MVHCCQKKERADKQTAARLRKRWSGINIHLVANCRLNDGAGGTGELIAVVEAELVSPLKEP